MAALSPKRKQKRQQMGEVGRVIERECGNLRGKMSD